MFCTVQQELQMFSIHICICPYIILPREVSGAVLDAISFNYIDKNSLNIFACVFHRRSEYLVFGEKTLNTNKSLLITVYVYFSGILISDHSYF